MEFALALVHLHFALALCLQIDGGQGEDASSRAQHTLLIGGEDRRKGASRSESRSVLISAPKSFEHVAHIGLNEIESSSIQHDANKVQDVLARLQGGRRMTSLDKNGRPVVKETSPAAYEMVRRATFAATTAMKRPSLGSPSSGQSAAGAAAAAIAAASSESSVVIAPRSVTPPPRLSATECAQSTSPPCPTAGAAKGEAAPAEPASPAPRVLQGRRASATPAAAEDSAQAVVEKGKHDKEPSHNSATRDAQQLSPSSAPPPLPRDSREEPDSADSSPSKVAPASPPIKFSTPPPPKTPPPENQPSVAKQRSLSTMTAAGPLAAVSRKASTPHMGVGGSLPPTARETVDPRAASQTSLLSSSSSLTSSTAPTTAPATVTVTFPTMLAPAPAPAPGSPSLDGSSPDDVSPLVVTTVRSAPAPLGQTNPAPKLNPPPAAAAEAEMFESECGDSLEAFAKMLGDKNAALEDIFEVINAKGSRTSLA